MQSLKHPFTRSPIADVRVRRANRQLVRAAGDYVLYWMIAARRPVWNVALDRAIGWARELEKPLIILEPLEVDYPYACDRFHRFVIDGMADNRDAFAKAPVTYYPYVEPHPGAGRGLVAALAERAYVVVTDDFPCFFLPRIVAALASRVDCAVEAVDGNGLLPMHATDRVFTAAFHFRRYVQNTLPELMRTMPRATPFAGVTLPRLERVPAAISKRWPAATGALLDGDAAALRALPIDHKVGTVKARGGARAAQAAMKEFVRKGLKTYRDIHNEPQQKGTSRLSPYLHFGHIAAQQIVAAILAAEKKAGPARQARPATGAREGWWGLSPSAEAYLDQLIVWRELGYNMCAKRPDDYDRYDSLPAWALATLADHRNDPRLAVYDRPDFENGRTHDPLWNAIQGQLRHDGWFHNFMRLVWGKKMLEWSASPQQALADMTEIMNKWSLDGRNPNSYTGYFWTLGRYDRPWPERPVYGKVRTMSTERTAQKVAVGDYIAKYTALLPARARRQGRASQAVRSPAKRTRSKSL